MKSRFHALLSRIYREKLGPDEVSELFRENPGFARWVEEQSKLEAQINPEFARRTRDYVYGGDHER